MLSDIFEYKFPGPVEAAIDGLENRVKQYKALTGKEIDEDTRIGLVIARLPDRRTHEHLQLNVGRILD